MNIPLVDDNQEFDCCVRLYRRAVWNTLLHLRPKYCLEIGTFQGQTSKVFSRYLQLFQSEGHLITTDICKWRDIDLPQVKQVMVYPHHLDSEKYHGGIHVHFQDVQQVLSEKSGTKANVEIIHEVMKELNIPAFDFIFVDGDHTAVSFIGDLLICKLLGSRAAYILIDDVRDPNHEQAQKFADLCSFNEFYEFEDWGERQYNEEGSGPIRPGLALIRNDQLDLGHHESLSCL